LKFSIRAMCRIGERAIRALTGRPYLEVQMAVWFLSRSQGEYEASLGRRRAGSARTGSTRFRRYWRLGIGSRLTDRPVAECIAQEANSTRADAAFSATSFNEAMGFTPVMRVSTLEMKQNFPGCRGRDEGGFNAR
jgi:hypothetical protein